MARAAAPAKFKELHAQSYADFWGGMHLFNQYRALMGVLACLAFIAALHYDTFFDFLSDAAAWAGIKDYHQAGLWFWFGLFILATIGGATYALNWGVIAIIARWQRNYTVRLLSATSLLWVYAMSDQTGAREPLPPTRWQRFIRALSGKQRSKRSMPGTLAEWLTNLTQHFNAASRRIGRLDSPAMLLATPWLTGCLGSLYFVLSNSRFLNTYVYPADTRQMLAFIPFLPIHANKPWLADPGFPHLILSFYLYLLVGSTVTLACQTGRRIGIRQALMSYLGIKDPQSRSDGQG